MDSFANAKDCSCRNIAFVQESLDPIGEAYEIAVVNSLANGTGVFLIYRYTYIGIIKWMFRCKKYLFPSDVNLYYLDFYKITDCKSVLVS